MKINDNIEITNEDNMVLMARYPDNYFDLAVVDPPYGLGKRTTDGGGTNSQIKFMDDIRRTNWDDNKPNAEYFKELFRVSKNQIIWGGNYFDLPPTRTIICWDKVVLIPTMSQIEIAWTSFDSPARLIKVNNTDKKRFHPTQKPVGLYERIFKEFAKENFKIIDTHLGSGNIAKALDKVNKHDKMNLSLVACEIDKDYFEDSIKNIKHETLIQTLF